MVTVRLARMAMACRFELVLQGDDEPWLRAAGEEALAEIARLEAQLSIFEPTSEVSHINARAGREPVRIEPRLFALLQKAQRLHEETHGAFDLTVAPLMRAWGFFRDTGHLPDSDVLEQARSLTGMEKIRLDPSDYTVRFEQDGILLDFGAIGKGYAVDEAVELLRQAGVERAFLHGGTSTMYGLGQPIDEDAWKVAIPRPDETNTALAVVHLENESLSVSAVWGKAFEAGGQHYGHVLDPRLGKPVDGAVLAAVTMENAADADALSTALLVNGRRYLPDRQRARALVLFPPDDNETFEIVEVGLSSLASDAVRVTTTTKQIES